MALAAEDIEARAEEILARVPAWLWDGETLPVPVEDIADSAFGLLVRDADDMASAPGAPELEPGQAISGLLLPSLGEIWVNAHEARQWPGRRRFTICHELGHWCMHRREGQSVFCRAATVEPAPDDAARAGATAGAAQPAIPPMEEEAQVFAAAILIPARLLRQEYKRERDFWRLCGRFGTSGAAMGRRLHAVI